MQDSTQTNIKLLKTTSPREEVFECLKNATKRVEEDPNIQKIMIIYLDDRNETYNTGWCSNLYASEGLALLEVLKTRLLKQMGYLLGPEI